MFYVGIGLRGCMDESTTAILDPRQVRPVAGEAVQHGQWWDDTKKRFTGRCCRSISVSRGTDR